MSTCLRLILGLLSGIVMLMLPLPQAYAQAPTIRVGVFEQAPDLRMGDDGRTAGIMGKLLNEIARLEGWSLRPVLCDWAQCMQWLADGKIDLLPNVSFTPERARRFSFHHVAALNRWSQIYTTTANPPQSIEDLQGRKIAVLAGSVQESYLHMLSEKLQIHLQLIAVPQMPEGFQLVRSHLADGVAADYFYGALKAADYGLAPTAILFQPVQTFYATRKGHNLQVLAAIDRHLDAWKTQPDSIYYRTLTRGSALPATLNANTDGTDDGLMLYLLAGLLAATLALTSAFGIRLVRQRKSLSTHESHLMTVLESVNAIVSTKDRDRRYLYANPRLGDFLGVDADTLIGKRNEDLFEPTDSLETIRHHEQAVLETGHRQITEVDLTPRGQALAHTFLTIKAPLLDPDGSVQAIYTVATDITDRVQAEAKARRLSSHDSLTNLPNRRTALQRLEQLLIRCKTRRSVGALLVLDLDGFKKINDLHGHHVGDAFLCDIATRLGETTRDRDLVSRSSADEFLVLLDGLGDNLNEAARNALHVAQKLHDAVGSKAFLFADKPAFVTVSIGLTLIHSHESVDHVLREADLAVQRAKDLGGNQVTFYEQDLQSEVEQRLWLEHDLLQALNSEQLQLYLQPQFSADNRVTGAELLARWHHPTRGDIPPSLFIPVAEASGLINLLGEWSLKFACETLIALQRLGETYPLSLNVSPRRLMEPRFVEFVRDMLERTGVAGNRLIFEVTEGVLIQDTGTVAGRMRELARLGIRFSIDDFGTGYSNLAYLKRLPLYELKIDKSLIQDVPDDGDNVAIVQLILAMADQLDLRVVGEGVETIAQSDFLFQRGCHALQGYLLARPMPVEDWLEQVRQRHDG